MKRLLIVLFTVVLLCTSTLTCRIVLADESLETEQNTKSTETEVLDQNSKNSETDSENDVTLTEDQPNDEQADEPSEQEADPYYTESPSESGNDVSGVEEGSEETGDGEAYAVLLENGDLVFFRSYETYTNRTDATVVDIKGNEYTGTVYTDIEKESYSTGPYSSWQVNDKVKKAYVAEGQTIKPLYMGGWFDRNTSLTEFNGKGFDTSDVTEMGSMFSGCSSLTKVTFDGFDTSKVTWISSMLSRCVSLTDIDLSMLDLSSCSNMNGLFSGCKKLKTVKLCNTKTPLLENTASMFYGCSSLSSVNFGKLDTSSVNNMSSMFSGCSSLSTLDLSKIDTSSVESMGYMFMGCKSLKSVNLSGLDTSNVSNMNSMFSGCSSLTSLDVSGFKASSLSDIKLMFRDCSSLKTLKMFSLSGSKLTSIGSLFSGCSSLTSVELNKLYARSITDISRLFEGCSSITSIDFSSFNTSNITDMGDLFYDCTSLSSVDLSSLNTANVTNMSGMFGNCSSLKSLDLSSFNTAKVETMGGMFDGCSSLRSIDLSGFNTSSLTAMNYMFSKCESLSSVDLSTFNKANIKYIEGLFEYCYSLTSADLSMLHTSSVKDMSDLFYKCSSLKTVNLKNLDTSSVTDMSGMFWGCSSIGEIDLGNFVTSNTNYMSSMFYDCSALTQLDISSFDTSSVSSMGTMFHGCDSLNTVILSPAFTKWIDESYLPDGVWTNGTIRKTEEELYDEYPSHSVDWEGKWVRTSESVDPRIVVNYYKNIDGESSVYPDYTKSVLDDTLYIESANLFARDGYDLVSWNTKPDGSGVSYKPNQKLTNSGSSAIYLDLYAQWEERPKSRYSQTWVLSTDASLMAGGNLGFTVGDADLTLGKALLGGEGGDKISMTVSTEGAKTELKIKDEVNGKGKGKISLGPKIGEEASKLKVIDVSASGDAESGITYATELVIDDYDPFNTEQQVELGKFYLNLFARKSRMTLLEKLSAKIGTAKNSATVANKLEYGADLTIGSADLGMVKGSVYNVGKGGSASYSKTLKTDPSTNELLIVQNSSVTAYDPKANVLSFKLGFKDKVPGSILGMEDDIKVGTGFNLGSVAGDCEEIEQSVSVTNRSGNIDKIQFVDSQSYKTTKFLESEQVTQKTTITYEGASADKYGKYNSQIKAFANDKFKFIFLDGYKTLVESPKKTGYLTAGYTIDVEESDAESVKLPFNLGAGLEFDLELGASGKYSLSYQTARGKIDKNGTTVLDDTNYGDIAKASTKSGDIVSILYSSIKFLDFGNLIKSISSELGQAIVDELVQAKEAIKDSYKDLKICIVRLFNDGDPKNSGLYDCYEISVYSAVNSNNFALNGISEYGGVFEESSAYTLGDPYYVYLEDQNGELITEFADKPMELTLEYDDQMLENAGISSQQAGNLYIYKYVEELCGYVCIGGTRDVDEHSITATITEAGEYIIAADYTAPRISGFNVSDYSAAPRIDVYFDEASLFNDISIKVDGNEVVNSENWKEFFIGSSKMISLTPNEELEDGEHTVTIYAVDSAGNAMDIPLVYTFLVDTKAPELDDYKLSYDDSAIRIRAWCSEKDISSITMILHQNVSGEEQKTEYELDRMDDYFTVSTDYSKADDAFIDLRVSDMHGNQATIEGLSLSEAEKAADVANDLRYVLQENEFCYTGAAIKPLVEVYEGITLLQEKKDYTIAFKNNTKTGIALITVTGKGNYNNKDTIEFSILPRDLNDKDIFIAPLDDMKYTGKPLLAKPVIKYNGKNLKANSDYDLEYSGDTTAIGSVTLTLKGKGYFTGERTLSYKIVDADQILVSKLSVTKPKDMEYTGEPLMPDLIVKNGKEILEEDQDYTLEYLDNTNIGTATIIIRGMNAYSGVKMINFRIVGVPLSKAKIDKTSLPSSLNYDGSEKLVHPILTYQKDKNSPLITLEEGKDYDISYTSNTNAGNASLIIEGKGLYTGTIKKTVRILPYDLSKDSDHKIEVYYGDTVFYCKAGAKPDVEVYYGDTLLKEGIDYTLSYKNNTKVNDGSVLNKAPSFVIKGKGNFKGSSIAYTYRIDARSLKDDVLMTSADKVYSLSKNGWKATPVLTDHGKKLSAGTDYNKNIIYTYEFINGSVKDGSSKEKEKPVIERNVGDIVHDSDIVPAGSKIRITVNGLNSYYDSISYVYRIVTCDISKASIKVVPKAYTGKEVRLSKEDITIKLGKVIVSSESYEIDESSYVNNINKGKASVIIRGVNDFGSSKNISFTIGSKSFLWWWRNLWQ